MPSCSCKWLHSLPSNAICMQPWLSLAIHTHCQPCLCLLVFCPTGWSSGSRNSARGYQLLLGTITHPSPHCPCGQLHCAETWVAPPTGSSGMGSCQCCAGWPSRAHTCSCHFGGPPPKTLEPFQQQQGLGAASLQLPWAQHPCCRPGQVRGSSHSAEKPDYKEATSPPCPWDFPGFLLPLTPSLVPLRTLPE